MSADFKPPHVTVGRVPSFTTPPLNPTGGATVYVNPAAAHDDVEVNAVTSELASDFTGESDGE